MPVAKIAEISSTSSGGFEAAIRDGLERASKTLENISGAWINDMKVDCENGRITSYRVNLRVTFVLKD